MTFGIQLDMVKWWSGVEGIADDAKVTQVISDVDTLLRYWVKPDVIAALLTDTPLRAVVRTAAEELCAGYVYARFFRLPDRSASWSFGDVSVSPQKMDPTDPSGMIQRAYMRLKPFLVYDQERAPTASIFGIGGKQGSDHQL